MTIAMTTDYQTDHRRQQDMPVSVQILSTLVFGGFAITAVVMAFVHFWPAGFLLAAILGWRGGFAPRNFTQTNVDDIVETLKTLGPEAAQRWSGNASFDAYRKDIIQRLEGERTNFENFLGRLREAKDKSEFDTFMDERAKKSRLDDDNDDK